ncbi:hypothetical protein ACVWVY_007704 [Bradyrhizobium sp. URHC0002]
MRIDVIHLCRLQQSGDGCPGPATAVAARAERIFPRNCLWPYCPPDDVRVDLEEPANQAGRAALTCRFALAGRAGLRMIKMMSL